MKTFFILAFTFICHTAIAQQPYDTAYPGNCTRMDYDEVFSMSLAYNTFNLHAEFCGNCCGENFLIYRVSNDTIHIHKVHQGDFCLCQCYYPVYVFIHDCNLEAYRVMVYESGIDTLIFSQTSGIENEGSNNSQEIVSFPNPSTNQFTINLPDNSSGKFNLEMFDSNGKIVLIRFNLFGNAIDIEHDNLPDGIYYLKLTNEQNQKLESRMVIQYK